MVDRREIEHIALLAKIDVSREDDKFFENINSLIAMIGSVGEIKLSVSMDECPLDTEFSGVFREDTAKPSIPRQAVLANAPEIEAGCISVPKIRGKGE